MITTERPQGHTLPRALAHRGAPLAIIGLALVLALPSIAVRFCTDDYAFRARLAAGAAVRVPFYDLFRFSSGLEKSNRLAVHVGILPWWTAADFKLHLIRPLTSALFALDDRLFGDHPLGYHLHSLGWYLLLLVAIGAIARRVLGDMTGTIALLVFAVRGAHAVPYAWIAARHVLVGAAPAMLGLAAHLRARAPERPWRPGWVLAPLGLVLGLAGSEAALAAVPFFVAYEVFAPAPSLARRVMRASPFVAIALLYLVAYRVAGGGANASGGYHDPIADPAGFAHVAVQRVPVLLGDALLGVPAESSLVWPGIVGVALVVALVVRCRRSFSERERAALPWLVSGSTLATIVGVAGLPGGRVLVIPDLGFAALIAVLLRRALAGGWAPSIGGGILAVAHVLLAPMFSLHAIGKLCNVARATETIARGQESGPGGKRVFIVAASDPMVFLYPKGIIAAESRGSIRCWSVLSAAHAPHRLTRTGTRSFSLEPIGRALLDRSFDTLFRSADHPFRTGDEVRQCGAVIRVAAISSGKPSRLDVTFDAPLDADDLALLEWRDDRLQRFVLPGLGDSTELPWVAGPSGL